MLVNVLLLRHKLPLHTTSPWSSLQNPCLFILWGCRDLAYQYVWLIRHVSWKVIHFLDLNELHFYYTSATYKSPFKVKKPIYGHNLLFLSKLIINISLPITAFSPNLTSIFFMTFSCYTAAYFVASTSLFCFLSALVHVSWCFARISWVLSLIAFSSFIPKL